MSFSKIFQILFIIGSTFLIFIPEYLNNSWWCFSSSFSTFEDRRRVILHILLHSFKIRDSSLMISSHNCFSILRIIFTYPEHFMSCFHFFPPKAIFSNIIHFSWQLSFSNLTCASIKYPLISS